MNKKIFIVTLILVLAAVGVSLFWMIGKEPSLPAKTVAQATPSPVAKNTPSQAAQSVATPTKAPASTISHEAQTQDMSAKILSLLNVWSMTPISFYGKVVDGQGNPIEGAKAHMVPSSSIAAGKHDYDRTSDAQGHFSLTGIHGTDVIVSVSKEGYYTTPSASGTFGYIKEVSTYAPHADPKNPEIFVLRKKGVTESLIMHSFYQAEVAKDGTPTNLDFQTGKEISGADSVQIKIWTQDAGVPRNGRHPYPWKASLSVSGGGSQARTGDGYNFQAPTDGYASEEVISMQPNDPTWSTEMTKEYWFHFADGRYARAKIEFYIGGFQNVCVTSYLNPQPGHTNLEYNPDQAAQPANR